MKIKLIRTLCKIADEGEMKKTISAILTEKEILEIENRLRIMILLEEGHTQRAVAKKLGVGIATVTRGALALKKAGHSALTNRLKDV